MRRELAAAYPTILAGCEALQQNLTARKSSVLVAAAGKLPWIEIQKEIDSPAPAIDDAISGLNIEAAAMEALVDERSRELLTSEFDDLEARAKLSSNRALAIEIVRRRDIANILGKCIDALSTTSISRKSTELSKTLATQEVADALNEELQALNVHDLEIGMKPHSPGGRTQFKLTLQLPGGKYPSAILSEGEQRAIAIASFLAEVRLGRGKGGVIFDDPVSSLDHKRRWHVARRLIREAKIRQVIVFTHDIYFLCLLEKEAKLDLVRFNAECITQGPSGFGTKADRLPFDALTTKKRVSELREMQKADEKAYKAGNMVEHTRLSREAYSHLRMAWERAVEEVLFQEAVERFGEGVSTQRLKRVVVDDDDYHEINRGMTKSSVYSGHDAAKPAQVPVAHPDELLADIESLEAWRKRTDERSKEVETRRTKAST